MMNGALPKVGSVPTFMCLSAPAAAAALGLAAADAAAEATGGALAAGLAVAAAVATAAGLDAGADGAGELAAGAAPPPHAARTSRGRLASPFCSEFMRCMVAQPVRISPSDGTAHATADFQRGAGDIRSMSRGQEQDG